MNAVWTIAGREVRDAVRSRWLLLYGVAFAVLALGLSYLGERNLGSLGFENFSRTTASLINLCLLLAPLIGLSMGAGSIAGEKERGNLTYLLAQPIDRWELLAGKFVGLVLSISVATVIGFGVAGLVIAFFATTMDVATYLFLLILMLALVTVMTALGLLASVVSASRVQALGLAMLVWFVTVLLFDLVLIGAVSSTSLGGNGLFFALLANPVEIVRVLAVIHLEPDLEVLGPFGSYLMETSGVWEATRILAVALIVWTAAPLYLAVRLFEKRGA